MPPRDKDKHEASALLGVQGLLFTLEEGGHDPSLNVETGLAALVKTYGEAEVTIAVSEAEPWLLDEAGRVARMILFHREAKRVIGQITGANVVKLPPKDRR